MASLRTTAGARALAGLLLLGGAASALAVPRVLIYQSLRATTKEGDPNVNIANYLAQEMDEAGRVSPVVWSASDPAFREATSSGKVRIPAQPKLNDVMNVARQLNADYVLMCDAVRAGGDAKASATLYKIGRQVWKDSINMHVGGDTYDPEGTAQSVSRTLVLKMTTAVWKDLTVKPTVPTPDPARGQAPVPPPVEVPVIPKVDNSRLRNSVQDFLKAKQYSSAVNALRDAVDADPFDAERRTMLIDVLREQDPIAAADEAARASELIPDQPEFRILAARAYMRAGRTKEAQEALNEAIARAPEATATRLLLAELALTSNEPEKALVHLDQAIKNEPTADGYFLRALCRAMLGGVDGVQLDLEAMEKASPEKSPADIQRRYEMMIPVLDRLLKRASDDVRSMIQKASVRPKDTELKDSLETTQRMLAARIALLQGMPHSPDVQKNLDRWILAHKLLAQSLVDLQGFLGGDAESITDARINLGEAIKQATQARGETAPAN